MKVIINVRKGMVESVYSEMESLDIVVNDYDRFECTDGEWEEPITDDMTCLYEI